MDFLALREAVLDNIVRDDLDNARLGRYVNWATQRVARYHNWRDLYVKGTIDLVIAQAEYDLPTATDKVKDIVGITLITSTAATKLEAVPYRRLLELIPNPSATTGGSPKYYAMWDNEIVLWPIPDAEDELEIVYVKWPNALVANTDEVEISGIDDIIVAAATFTGFSSLQMKEEAAYWEQVFRSLLAEAVNSDSRHTDHQLALQGFRAEQRQAPVQNDPFSR